MSSKCGLQNYTYGGVTTFFFATFAPTLRSLRSKALSPDPLVISRDQIVPPFAHRRQIILPAPLPPARLNLLIPSLHFVFTITPHARHHFQIPDHGLCNPRRD